MINLETERLTLRQWNRSDYEIIKNFFSREENVHFIGGVQSPEAAWRLMATYIGHYSLFGYSYMALESKESGKLVGTVGLWNSDPWPEPELGYWMLPEGRGKGLATEAGMVAKKFAEETIKLSSLVSFIHKNNQPSMEVAKRLGAQREKSIDFLDFGEHDVYRYY